MGSGAHLTWMPAAPWIHLLSCLFLPSLVMAHLECTYNSWTLLSCSWETEENFTSSPCYICANVTDEERNINDLCFLTLNGNPRSCTINLTTDGNPIKEMLTADHRLNISVICINGTESNTSVKFLSDFSAYHNLLLDPPVSADIKMINHGAWKLTWDISHSSYIKQIETEICYKPVSQSWQDAQNVKVKNDSLVILEKLDPNTQYEAKVRVTQTDFPGGRWSEWSKPVQWRTPQEGYLDCTHNSLDTVSCSWELDRNFISTLCYLEAVVVNTKEDRRIKGICFLPPNGVLRSCVMNVTSHGQYHRDVMTVGHKMNVNVICNVGKKKNKTVTSISRFYPFLSLRLDPPTSLNIKRKEDGTWNLTWHNNYRDYIKSVETEVHFKPAKWPWEAANRFTIVQTDVSALLRDLQPDTLYEAKVRINQTEYSGGRWSDWSKAVQWTTPPKASAFPIPGLVAVIVVFLIVVLILCSTKRVKKIMWITVPDPSPFFHPLINNHEGNFKQWLSTPYAISPFFTDPNPLVISPLKINCKVEEQHVKFPPTAKSELDKDKSGHSGSSFINKEYFSSVYLGYDHFPTTVVNEPLHSPTDEHMPLFEAEYLCAPQSIAGFGVHNGSFERDASPRVMAMPLLLEETFTKPECNEENNDISSHQEMENGREKEETEMFQDQKESLDTFSKAPMAQKHDVKPLKEADGAADYLSLKELHQKHCRWV